MKLRVYLHIKYLSDELLKHFRTFMGLLNESIQKLLYSKSKILLRLNGKCDTTSPQHIIMGVNKIVCLFNLIPQPQIHYLTV